MISHFVVLLLTIIKAGCVLNSTRTVKLSSKNLMTFLTWEPATGSSSETLYQVEYKLYDDSRWIQKKECWNITMVQCDLTKDIAHVTQRMSGQVRAISHGTVSDWAEAKMSIPHSDMTIDPPIFNLVPETNSMQVHIHPSFENCTGVAKMEYMINLKQRNGSILSSKTTALTDRLEDLAPATEYCVTVSSKIWISHAQGTPHDYESAKRETCAFTETDHRHLQLIIRFTVGLIIPLLLISALLLLMWAFRSVHRPPAALPLNLTFTVEEWKTLKRKSYVDVKQCDDNSADRIASNWIQSKAKTNPYVKLPQRTLLSERPIVNHSHKPLMGFSTPPPLLEGVRRVQGYAPQLSCPAAQTDESYGVVQHGLGLTLHDCSVANINQLTFSSAEPESGKALYINSEHPEPAYTNTKHPELVYTKSEHSKSVYINSEQPKPDYANSKHPKPISTDSEHLKPVYSNYKCSEPVYTNLEHPKPVDTNSEH